MRQIVLIGTSHPSQKPKSADSASFGPFVENICSQYCIAAIGEEMNEDALAENGEAQSVCHQIALSRGFAHRYCDPDRMQRAAMGILQENDVKLKAWKEQWPERGRKREARIKRELRASDAARERYWLERLIELDTWPALLVCGANHVRYFCDLAEKQGFEVRVAADDWEPNSASVTDTI
jgi:hypothetical protein